MGQALCTITYRKAEPLVYGLRLWVKLSHCLDCLYQGNLLSHTLTRPSYVGNFIGMDSLALMLSMSFSRAIHCAMTLNRFTAIVPFGDSEYALTTACTLSVVGLSCE